MDIYNYHPITGEYLSAGVADENPLDANDPIVPGFATPVRPPAIPDGMAAVYKSQFGTVPQNWPEGAWSLVRDYRAAPLYRTEDGAVYLFDGTFHGLGELPAGVTEVPRPSASHVWRNGAWEGDEALEAMQLTADAEAKRTAMLADADAQIAPLMDAFVLGELSEGEEQKLRAFSQYRKALRALDLSDPRAIVWPDAPA
ncbi:tail fiber assembly protein [Cupriavidus gilardii]|uniref:tail fiber assembly protein n=1 Tax=Cupriavidus gilardii TaxID=82541 RepID=UPI0021B49F97|nr:tail fiber assembly protein [Cupriavidus gilardii]UXC37198.1 tail fiber assembly protein [Cupriavidus gilardii]